MTRWCQDTFGPLFSHFGVRQAGAISGTPLVFLNGAVMVDSGNEDPAYLFECQDRYPVYAALAGMRCLFLVRDDDHALQYQTAIAALAPRLATIRQYTGSLLNGGVASLPWRSRRRRLARAGSTTSK